MGEPVCFRFGPFELAPAQARLSRGPSEVPLPRKSFELLVHLVRHRQRVVPRHELLAAVWRDVVVSDAAFESALRDLRRALDDASEPRRFVATVRGRGLRFVGEVREVPDEPVSDGGAWEAAAVHFERALRALELVHAGRGEATPGDAAAPRDRAELLVALARARWAAGDTEQARAAFLDAAEVARRAGDAEVLARAALGYVGRSDATPGVNRRAVALLEEALDALPERDGALRAELLARLGTELYYEDDGARSEAYTAQALAMAERLGEPAAIAYACTSRHYALQRPDVAPEERLPLTDRATSLLGEGPPSDVLGFALQERLFDLLELGDGPSLDTTLRRYSAVVEALEQPFFTWILALHRGNRALMAGRVDEAERLSSEALALGRRLGSPNADAAFGAQLYALRREQGRLGELVPVLAELADRYPALPIYRAALAGAAAESDAAAARSALDELLAGRLEDFPRDQHWIATLGTLAPAVAAVGDDGQRALLVELLSPFAGRMIAVGYGAATHGAVSHQLGLLRAALGQRAAAARDLAAAEALHARAGAPAWAERSRRLREALEPEPQRQPDER